MAGAAPPPSPSRLARRLRALMRKALAGFGGGVEGFVDGVVAGEIRGWALDPRRPNRRVHVLAVCEGGVVAEALADLTRLDLIKDGRGDGRHAFRLRLPPAVMDGAARTVRVEAVSGARRVRLLRGEVRIEPEDAEAVARPSAAGAAPAASVVTERPAGALVLAISGDGDGAERTAADWRALAWPELEVVRGGEDIRRLALSHTVVFAQAGDRIDPAIAPALARAHPLHDVLTWDGLGDGADQAGRRPEARPLGVLLGERLGAFAVRGHVLAADPGLAQAWRAGEARRLELRLAAHGGLRWAHLPAALTRRGGSAVAWTPIDAAEASGLAGYVWRPAEGGRPSRLAPDLVLRRLSLGVWPAWDAEADQSARALVSQLPDGMEAELLVDAASADHVRSGFGDQVRVIPVDLGMSARGGAGAWLRALGAAASGEAVVICRAGAVLDDRPRALEELAAWALSPLVGTATLRIDGGPAPLAGLALARRPSGWRLGSAYAAAKDGRPRPVLAAPSAFLAVGRAKLAASGALEDPRIPGQAADLDLALKLRRMGAAGLLLGDLTARASAQAGGTAEGADFAGFDWAELAAAAEAYPAPEGP